MPATGLTVKPHYQVLDALRGVAAIMVVCFHLFEAHSKGELYQIINHGYLAVDFFFVLSGFVIGYAYDDRWGKMGVGEFFKRRLIRLQPLVIIGMIVGAICFYYQDGVLWPLIHTVPVWRMLLVMVIGFTLIPVPVSMDIRGWAEMHPLNGPGWSLFFEYVANIMYGLFIRKFSNKALSVLVFIAACALIELAVDSPKGDVIGGWSIDSIQLRIGFTRLMYPFFAGLLLSRVGKPVHIKHAFILCSLLLILVLAIPRIGGEKHLWMNGLYDSLTIIFIFPLIVFMGASGQLTGKYLTGFTNFLGKVSYPIYITHYPIIYLYTAWVADTKISVMDAWPKALVALGVIILLGYLSLKLFDEPVRKWLTNRVLPRQIPVNVTGSGGLQ